MSQVLRYKNQIRGNRQKLTGKEKWTERRGVAKKTREKQIRKERQTYEYRLCGTNHLPSYAFIGIRCPPITKR